MKSLIVGAGEVGKALFEIINKKHESHIRDIEPLDVTGIEVLNICYPDSHRFVEITQKYIDEYKPKLTIIHSSISIGSTDKFDEKVVYSPIRGRHNRVNALGHKDQGLEFDITQYSKFIFGHEYYRKIAEEYFKQCGLETYSYQCSQRHDGEILKLISNAHMGVEIAFRQEVERILRQYAVDPYTYYKWELSYQQGYKKCGDEHLIRPIMNPAPIGGHCIITCTEILMKQFPSKIFDFILESNEKAKHKV